MNFQDYKDFTIEDFLEDVYFRESMLRPTSESDRFWAQFVRDFPQQKQIVTEAKDLFLSLKSHYQEEIQKVSNERAKASFQVLEAKMKKHTPTRQISRRQWIVGSTAACLSLLIGVGGYFLSREISPVVYSTGNGQRISVELPDHSTVQLNANSKIYLYPGEWEKKAQREVWLEGEAFFSVDRKAAGTKFIVHAGELNISVLGTQFNVRARGEDANVTLTEGKVELAVADQQITMKPGEMLSYKKSESLVEVTEVQTETYASWKDGISVFNDTLQNVVKELEILYGVHFVIENEQLKNRKIQLSAPNDSLEEVLETLKLLYPEEIRIREEEGQMIIF